MKRILIFVGLAGLALTLAACAAESAESQHAASGGVLSQLLLGFWHGLIAPVMLIIEVIDKFAPHLLPWDVKFYESRGTGVVYDVGFYFGLAGGPPIVFSTWSRRR